MFKEFEKISKSDEYTQFMDMEVVAMWAMSSLISLSRCCRLVLSLDSTGKNLVVIQLANDDGSRLENGARARITIAGEQDANSCLYHSVISVTSFLAHKLHYKWHELHIERI